MKIANLLLFLVIGHEISLMQAHTLDIAIPNIGLSIEISGQVLKSQEIVSIPAILSLGYTPALFAVTNTTQECKAKLDATKTFIYATLKSMVASNIDGLLSIQETKALGTMLCQYEPDLCEMFQPGATPRPKRFILATGAILGAGIGAIGYWLYDKIAGADASKTITELQSAVQSIRDELLIQHGNIVKLSTTLKQVWSVTLHDHEDISKMKIRLSCSESMEETILKAMPVMSTIPNQFHRAINNLLAGKVTPDLISYAQLKKFLEVYPLLQDTLYQYDGGLFYQLSHTIPVAARASEGYISFLVQTPKITKESVGILFEINNFGIHNDTVVTRIKIPHYIARFKTGDNVYIYSPVAMDKCETSPGLWMCGQHAFDFTYDSTCLKSLLTGTTSGCTWEVKRNYLDPDILVTRASLFYHSSIYPATFFNISKGGKSSKVIHPQSVASHWSPLISFDTMIIERHHIDGHRTLLTNTIITEAKIEYYLPNISTAYISEDTWQGIDAVNSSMTILDGIISTGISESLSLLSFHTVQTLGLNLLIWTIITIGVLVVFYVSCRRKQREAETNPATKYAALRMSQLERKHTLE